jgi:phosphatidylinositol alpha-1,6-mannosyltransferase
MITNCRIAVGATLLEPGKGGIASVARMTIRALAEGGPSIKAVTFLDREPIFIGKTSARTASGNKLRYLAMCHHAAWGADYAVYDSVGMARAHPRYGRIARRYVVWIHGVEVWYDLHTDRKRALDNAFMVLVNSSFTLAKYEALHGKLPNARVCLLATEAEEFPEAAPQFDGPPTVLCIARMDTTQRYKGHRELIVAWPGVVSAVPGARLILAGGGDDLDAIRALVRASPVATAIEVPGFVAEAEIANLWRRAHVFAMPSRGEGFGLVYIEAMRHGLPVIASVHDAGQEINVDGVTGFNVDLDAPGALAGRLVALLRDTEVARRLGQAGHERWKTHFRFSAFRDRFLAIMQDFTGERIGSPSMSAGSRT